MSLTSYRAAPPRVIEIFKLADNWPGWPPLCRASFGRRFASPGLTEDLPGRASREWLLHPALIYMGLPRQIWPGEAGWQAWQRPTLPRLKTQYHRR